MGSGRGSQSGAGSKESTAIGPQEHVQQIHARHPVDHAVMDLGDHREVLATLEALHDPHLPERLRAIEVLRHDPRSEAFQLALVPWPRQRRVSDVVMNVEVGIVDPHGMVLERDERQALAVARDQVEPRVHVAADAIDVDATFRCAQRADFVCRRSRHVHRRSRTFHDEERVVEEAQALVRAM